MNELMQRISSKPNAAYFSYENNVLCIALKLLLRLFGSRLFDSRF